MDICKVCGKSFVMIKGHLARSENCNPELKKRNEFARRLEREDIAIADDGEVWITGGSQIALFLKGKITLSELLKKEKLEANKRIIRNLIKFEKQHQVRLETRSIGNEFITKMVEADK